jgi:hypothetical protein
MRLLPIKVVILSVIIVILVLIFWFSGNKIPALLTLLVGGAVVVGIAVFGKRSEEQKYANMTRDLVVHLRHVNGFPYEDFAKQNSNLIDIVKYAENKIAESKTPEERLKYEAMDKEIDDAYKEFIKQKQEDKRAAAAAQAMRSSRTSYGYGNRYGGPSVNQFSLHL